MKKYLLATTAAGAALAISAPANAGNYLSLFGGYSMSDQTASARVFQTSGTFSDTFYNTGPLIPFSNHTHAAPKYAVTHYYSVFWRTTTFTQGTWKSATDLDFEIDNGFVVGAALGKEIASGLRGEIEIAYRKHDVKATGTHYYWTAFSGVGYDAKYWFAFSHVTEATTFATYDGSPVFNSDFIRTHTSDYLIHGSKSVMQHWTSKFPTEGGNYYTKSEVSASGDLSAMSIMANVWLDVDMNLGSVHPYIGAGVGYADVTLDIGGVDVSDSAMAFQVGAGIGWDLPNNGHRINVEVRRFVVPKLELTLDSWDIPLDYETTDVIVAYRINF